MCLGVPGQIVSIEGEFATLDVWGALIKVRLLDVVEEQLVVGDYVVEHAGSPAAKDPMLAAFRADWTPDPAAPPERGTAAEKIVHRRVQIASALAKARQFVITQAELDAAEERWLAVSEELEAR